MTPEDWTLAGLPTEPLRNDNPHSSNLFIISTRADLIERDYNRLNRSSTRFHHARIYGTASTREDNAWLASP